MKRICEKGYSWGHTKSIRSNGGTQNSQNARKKDTRRIHCGLNTNYTNGTNIGLLTKQAKLEKRDGLTNANYLKLYTDKTKPD